MTSQLQIKNPEEILTELENLRHKKKEMNWFFFLINFNLFV